MATKQETIEKLIRTAQDLKQSVTTEEFLAAFKKVTKAFASLREQNTQEVQTMKSDISQGLKDLVSAKSEDVEQIKKGITTSLAKMEKQLSTELNFIHDKVDSLTDGNDGVDADESAIVKEVLAQIKLPEQKELIVDTPEEIKEKIGLDEIVEDIKELKNRPVGRGGGTSAIGVAQTFKYIAHTEKPVGTIDSTNKVYTVSKDIWWIAGFTLNGEQIAELPNYTFIGRTITFGTALPSVYSGKDFEIKFIG